MDLVQALVGLPLRTPLGYVPYDSDADENDHNQLKPFDVGKEIVEDADYIWVWYLGALAEELPREAGKLMSGDLVGASKLAPAQKGIQLSLDQPDSNMRHNKDPSQEGMVPQFATLWAQCIADQ